jgi:outer membrane protein
MALLKGMDVATLNTRPDLTKRAQELHTKGQKQAVELQYIQQELLITEQKAFKAVAVKIDSILKSLAAEKGAAIILDKSMTIYTGPAADVTQTVISRLNSQMRTTPVNRERLPRRG